LVLKVVFNRFLLTEKSNMKPKKIKGKNV